MSLPHFVLPAFDGICHRPIPLPHRQLPLRWDALDTTGNGHDGTVYGATPATDRFGNDSACYQFNGIDDLIELAGAFNSSTGTIGAWVFIDDFDDLRPILTQRDSAYHGIATSIAINADGLQDTKRFYKETDRRDCPGGSGQLYFTNGDPMLEDSTWTNLIASSDGNLVHLYINCIEVATYPSSGGSDDPGYWFADMCMNPTTWIGAEKRLTDEWYFKGRIDDVRVYDCALNAAEITALCDLGMAVAATELRSSLSVHPNPTNGNVTITGEFSSEVANTIEVIDAQGRTVSTNSIKNRLLGNVALDLSGLPSGLYTLRCAGAVQRVVKQD